MVQHQLLEILRCSLWSEPYEDSLTTVDFMGILKLAEEQTVFGLVFDIVSDIQGIKAEEGSKEQMAIFEAVGLLESIKQQNAVLNKELLWFTNKCQEVKLNFLFVKGQTIACFYPKPELRQSGDIDFLVPVNYEFHLELNSIFPDVWIPNKLLEKEIGFEHKNVNYELHTRLVDFGSKKNQRLWENQIKKEWDDYYFTGLDGVKIRTLTPTTNSVYIFIHIFFHLIREGISLRQFCDWAVFLHANIEVIDRQKLIALMKKMGMHKGYRAFGCILVDELGLQENKFPMALTDNDRRWKEKILHDIFRGGNFGKQNHRAKSTLGFKLETFIMAARNCIRYYKLAPSEMGMMIPKMIGINLKILLN